MKILILLTLVGAIAAQQRSSNLIGEKRNIQNAIGFCQKHGSPLHRNKLIQMKAGPLGALDADEDARCFAECLLRNLRMLNPNNLVNPTVVQEKMQKFGASNIHTQQCLGVKAVANYPCLTGWSLLKCVCERTREFCKSL